MMVELQVKPGSRDQGVHITRRRKKRRDGAGNRATEAPCSQCRCGGPQVWAAKMGSERRDDADFTGPIALLLAETMAAVTVQRSILIQLLRDMPSFDWQAVQHRALSEARVHAEAGGFGAVHADGAALLDRAFDGIEARVRAQ